MKSLVNAKLFLIFAFQSKFNIFQMRLILLFLLFLLPLCTIAQSNDTDAEQIEILNFGHKYKARMDSLKQISEQLKYDSLYYLQEPEYVVIAPTRMRDSLKISNVDTLKFFFPPKVLLVDVNHYNDSISVYQASLDTMELRLNPKFMVVPSTVQVEEDNKPQYWTYGGGLRVHIAQVSLSNWNPGGESSLNASTEFRVFANKKRDNMELENRMELRYGVIRNGEKLDKNSDQIWFVSRQSRQVTKSWQLSALEDFRTQFQPGFNSDRKYISNFMAPGNLQLSLGFSYNRIKNLNVLVSPIKGKVTFLLDQELSDEGAFGVEAGKRMRSQLGSGLSVDFKETEIFPNIYYTSNLELFSPFQTFTRVVTNWTNNLRFQVNRYISTSIHSQIVYDHDIDITRDDGSKGPALQMRNEISLVFVLDYSK